ncbi:MAG: hypothetical protein KF746_22665 [Chitinophagaceae bacterium]|nr:hypothetical protein [Chitinophagaceae bacterium]
MKKQTGLLCLILFAGMIIFNACKKNDSGGDPPPAAENPLYKNAIGKWNINTTPGRTKQPNMVSSKIQDAADLVSIEFLSDTTYVIVSKDNDVFTGTFSAPDSSSINLSNFGKLTEIKIAGGTMNFKLSKDGNTILITANKAETIPLTVNTELLCKNWYLTEEDFGEDLYDEDIDKVTVLFSTAGTYLVQSFNKGIVIEAEIANWKWHPTEPNTFIYWWEELPDEDDKVKITELSKNKLRMEESYYEYDDDDNPTLITQKYVLIPASQVSGRIAGTAFIKHDKTAPKTKGIFRRR